MSERKPSFSTRAWTARPRSNERGKREQALKTKDKVKVSGRTPAKRRREKSARASAGQGEEERVLRWVFQTTVSEGAAP